MKLDELVEELTDINSELFEKAKEIREYVKEALNNLNSVDDEDFIDGTNDDFNNGVSELENIEYAVNELIDDLLK